MTTGKHILLIEDNVTLATGLQACLVSSDFQVRHFTNAEEALATCLERSPI